MKILTLITASIFVSPAFTSPDPTNITLSFDAFTLSYNCEKRGYNWSHYKTFADMGNLKRFTPFHVEERLPRHCRQFTTDSYKSPKGAPSFDRGHGVDQNPFDHNRELMRQTNSFANIVPQNSTLNRQGLWRYTEKLTECLRDGELMDIYAGVYWGADSSNDYFVNSHGVVTPDYLWKIIISETGRAVAWLMPNTSVPTEDNAEQFLVSPAYIEEVTGWHFNSIPTALKNQVAPSNWELPSSCNNYILG